MQKNASQIADEVLDKIAIFNPARMNPMLARQAKAMIRRPPPRPYTGIDTNIDPGNIAKGLMYGVPITGLAAAGIAANT